MEENSFHVFIQENSCDPIRPMGSGSYKGGHPIPALEMLSSGTRDQEQLQLLTFQTSLFRPLCFDGSYLPSHRGRHNLLGKCRRAGPHCLEFMEKHRVWLLGSSPSLSWSPWVTLAESLFGSHSANYRIRINNPWHTPPKQPLTQLNDIMNVSEFWWLKCSVNMRALIPHLLQFVV